MPAVNPRSTKKKKTQAEAVREAKQKNVNVKEKRISRFEENEEKEEQKELIKDENVQLEKKKSQASHKTKIVDGNFSSLLDFEKSMKEQTNKDIPKRA